MGILRFIIFLTVFSGGVSCSPDDHDHSTNDASDATDASDASDATDATDATRCHETISEIFKNECIVFFTDVTKYNKTISASFQNLAPLTI